MRDAAEVVSPTHWMEANRQYLWAALAEVRAALQRHIGEAEDVAAGTDPEPGHQSAALPVPPALESLCSTFRLSPFERSVLMLCAGMELDSTLATLCAGVHRDSQRPYPTFSLALAALPDPHWSALAPTAALRHWRLIEVGAGQTLTLSPLRIDERVLHFLAGVQHLDERLVSMVEPVEEGGRLLPSHARIADRLAAALARPAVGSSFPSIQLCGIDGESKRVIAAAACAALGVQLYALRADLLPTAPAELATLARLWTRETALEPAVLLLDCEDVDPTDTVRAAAISIVTERLGGPVIITTRDRRRDRGHRGVAFDVDRPTQREQRAVWEETLGAVQPGLNGQVDRLVAQFDLSTRAIRAAGDEALGRVDGHQTGDVGRLLWDACRTQARTGLDDLAQRIEPAASWDTLVLPEAQHAILREIVVHVRERTTVYQTWGFAEKGDRGLGISALFAGPSGTGKTMAAEVLGRELKLDLYRIDLSSVVSKYIGETEKNLRRVFDAADEGGAILLFDEADALFGKRSEVKDSHDRYANIEVSYLLQRMEAYRGLAILTTNLKKSLDPAFLRRIRFVVQFPFPDAPQRSEIWRRIFPAGTPTEGLDAAILSRLSVAGGNIRNIALQAAFLAADAGTPVQMRHLLRAARTEYAKLEKPLTGAETEGWE
jgi:hypothetical protein